MSWYDPFEKSYHDKHYYNLTALFNDYTHRGERCECYAGKIFAYIKSRCEAVYHKDDNFKVYYSDNRSKKSVLAISYHNVMIYNMVKRLGSDDYDVKTASYIAATMDLPRWNSTYTSWLGRQIEEDKLAESYPHRAKWLSNVFINDFSRGGLLFAVQNHTYCNCFKYDFKSYYPALMMLDKPLQYHYNPKNRDLSRVQLLHIHVDKIQAKNFNLLPLCVTQNMSKNNKSVIGNRISERAGGLVYAEDYDFWIYSFSEELIWYAYEITNGTVLRCFDIEFEHGCDALKTMRDTISNWFDIKEHHKDTANYKGYKVALNRLSHGFLLTTHNDPDNPDVKVPRNYNLPTDFGVYNVAYGQAFLFDIIKNRVGLEHVIAANTDCLVTDQEFPWLEDICVLPPELQQGKLGYLIKEEHYDKIRYIGPSSCIFETDGKLDAKLPGIRDCDKDNWLADKCFDDITIDTEIYLPSAIAIRETNTGIFVHKAYKKTTLKDNAAKRKYFEHNVGDENELEESD